MHQKKFDPKVWIPITIGLIIIVTASVLYGQGRLNLGQLSVQPVKTTETTAGCPDGGTKVDTYCSFKLQLGEYFVIKDGTNFVIYGPKVTKLFQTNNWSIDEGTTIQGSAWSLAKQKTFPMTLTFQWKEKNGDKVPSFVLDYPTAETIQGSRTVTVVFPDNTTKIAFDAFNLPDKNLIHR